MAKKNGNGEGSIYPHKKDGKKVGYRGAYTVYTAEALSAATSAVRPERRCATSSPKLWSTGTVGSSSTPDI